MAPKNLLIISLQIRHSRRLLHHLNDHVFISHTHQSDDPLPQLQHQRGRTIDDALEVESISSVIRTPQEIPGEMFSYRQLDSVPFISGEVCLERYTQCNVQLKSIVGNSNAAEADIYCVHES